VTSKTGRSDSRSRLRGLLAFAALTLLASSPGAAELGEAEVRGKQIYFEGTSPGGGEINAIVGDEAALLPASAMPCSSCHGSDGLGRPEGGVIPLDIRWSELVKTYGHVHHDGRRHPAFDDDGVARSIIAGVDQANNTLDRSMPIYQMSEQDIDDLVAYMKVLEFDLDPGLTDDDIRVATLLPLSGGAGAVGEAMRQVMEGYFAEVNQAAGIFGRRIELLAIPMGETPEASMDTLREAFDTESIFALVGAYSVGYDEELLGYLRSDNVPLIGAFTLDPGDAFLDAAAFYLFAGFDDQVRVLADRALADGARGRDIVIAGPAGTRAEPLLRVAQDRIREQDEEGEATLAIWSAGNFDAAEFAGKLADNASQALIFTGDQSELDALLVELANRDHAPRVYLLSSFVGRPLLDVPAAFHQRIFIAYPTTSQDITPRGREDYARIAERQSLPNEHIQAQLAALAAAKLFVEGLRRAGRDLSRTRLVEGIEQLYNFDTGVTPPLTFGPNRRIGALGAHIVTVDLENRRYVPVGWYNAG
jgi:ABC-type branched-subunit amino acid transport system substrate-binding protein